tara:strand:+ start:676 stop:903 length:228 start_codon:yes stop_codon:yes gene_type:complete
MTVKVTSTKWEDYTEEEKQWFADDSAKTKIADDEKLAKIEQQKADAKSGNQKLLDLGLTQAEATALTGYTPIVEE